MHMVGLLSLAVSMPYSSAPSPPTRAVETGGKPVQRTWAQQSGGGPGRGCWGRVILGPRHCSSPGALSVPSGHCSSCLSMRDRDQRLVTYRQKKRRNLVWLRWVCSSDSRARCAWEGMPMPHSKKGRSLGMGWTEGGGIPVSPPRLDGCCNHTSRSAQRPGLLRKAPLVALEWFPQSSQNETSSLTGILIHEYIKKQANGVRNWFNLINLD